MKNQRRTTAAQVNPTWRTSSYSGGNNECVEVADGVPDSIPVRDSKRPGAPAIGFSPEAWTAFLNQLR
jgi:hypothetical protein